MNRSQVVNFGAGPSTLPTAVLDDAARGLLNYNNTGIGLTELSHRSSDFTALTLRLEALLRTQLAIPASHAVLFTQGGGSAQFSAVVLNLLARHRLLHPHDNSPATADYILTGSWSQKAHEEAQRLAGLRLAPHIVVDARTHSDNGQRFDRIPPHAAFNFSPAPAFVYYCENETVDGVQFAADPALPTAFPFAKVPAGAPLVADMSSSFLSRPIPRLAEHALIFAGAQKNLGPAGLTVLIVRTDLLVDTDKAGVPVPRTMAYKTLADGGSLYNTPPMFAMYVAALVLERAQVRELTAANERKMQAVYEALDRAGDAVRLRVREGSRSWMNVVFEVLKGMEKTFLEGAEARGFRQLKGHRSVGGIRVSLYNAITEEQVQRLVTYMDEFFSAS